MRGSNQNSKLLRKSESKINRVARAAYEEAVKRRPGRIATLRQKTRLLADSRRNNQYPRPSQPPPREAAINDPPLCSLHIACDARQLPPARCRNSIAKWAAAHRPKPTPCKLAMQAEISYGKDQARCQRRSAPGPWQCRSVPGFSLPTGRVGH